MPKMRNKPRVPPDRVKHVSWSPDYGHQAWVDAWTHGEVHARPTRATHPDAFYREVTAAYPVVKGGSTRQKPHSTLSRTQLRKRLSRAGLSGAELRATLVRVVAGPTFDEMAKTGARGAVTLFMSWDIEQLKAMLGKRVARRVLRFLSTMFIVRDEYWDFANGLGPAMSWMYERARSFKPEVLPLPLDSADIEKLARTLIPDCAEACTASCPCQGGTCAGSSLVMT